MAYSWGRLYSQQIDVAWVLGLESAPELAEMLEAFTSRFGRMQDTIAGKLLPRWRLALAERAKEWTKQWWEGGVEQGVQQGEVAVLLRQIKRKCGPTVAAAFQQRVEQADAETLLEWAERVLTADTIDEVFH